MDVALPGQAQQAWEAPRTQPARTPARSHRLKGCGNAIVPAIPERFLYWIAQIEKAELEAANAGIRMSDAIDLDFA